MSKKRARSFILNKNIDFEEFSAIRVTWGIIRYSNDIPRPVNTINEGLLLLVFFGDKRVPSEHVWLPDTYPFIGLFLGGDEQAGVPFKSTFYHKTERLFCLGNPRPFETVTSVFDLKSIYLSLFGTDSPKPRTGIGLGINTLMAGGNNKAAAYINKIEILKKPASLKNGKLVSAISIFWILIVFQGGSGKFCAELKPEQVCTLQLLTEGNEKESKKWTKGKTRLSEAAFQDRYSLLSPFRGPGRDQ
jgi:hypothetical protein